MKIISKAKNLIFANWLCVLGIIFIVGGCGQSMEDYKATVRDGIKTVPHVQEIKQMFPGAPMDNFIGQSGYDQNVGIWNTVVYFSGRYELDYQVNVIVDYKKNKVGKVDGISRFLLLEVATVSKPTPGGAVGGTYKSSDKVSHVFGEEQWNKIVAAKGDFSVIGIHLITNSPIPGFDDYVHGWRKDRVQVEP